MNLRNVLVPVSGMITIYLCAYSVGVHREVNWLLSWFFMAGSTVTMLLLFNWINTLLKLIDNQAALIEVYKKYYDQTIES